MNRCLIICFCLLSASLAAHSVSPLEEINFRTGDFQAIREFAMREGKPLFVHFTASWCMPCQWMEKNTFKDKSLADFVNERFLAVKIDIDDPEGARIKEEFQVVALPSMLIFDTRSIVVGRYEESMPASRLEQIMRRHFQEISGTLAQGAAPPSPLLNTSPPKQTETVFRPSPTPEGTSGEPGPSTNLFSPPQSVNSPSAPGVFPPSTTAASTPPAPASASPVSRFGIQLGVFSTYDNAYRQLGQFRDRFPYPVSIYAGVLDGKNVYRILLGTFNSKEEAENLARRLKDDQQLQVIVKDLSKL